MEFMGPPMSWYDPPNLHEICGCMDCHIDGEHTDDVEHWANVEGCFACVDNVRKAVDNNEYCLLHHAWYCEKPHDGEILTLDSSQNLVDLKESN